MPNLPQNRRNNARDRIQKPIPDRVHFWRGKQWKQLQKREYRRGDTLRRIWAVQRVVKEFQELKNAGKLTQRRLRSQAEAITKMLTIFTDEYFIDEGKMPSEVPSAEWTKMYNTALDVFSKKALIPTELLEEMERQRREE